MGLLSVQAVSKYFGGLCALHKVSFDVQPRQITGLIGPNGAGKTTMFNLITGVFPVSAGRILWNEVEITNVPTHLVAQMGIIRTFQNVNLFFDLSARDNVVLGMHRKMRVGMISAAVGAPSVRRIEAEAKRRADDILRFVGLGGRENEKASNLPFGYQRLLELARALAAEPELLLLDEPAAGLNDDETSSLAELLCRIRESGTTILLVEHDMRLVMDVCDRIVVLNFGEKIAEGTPSEIQENALVSAAYLGRGHK